MDLGGGSDPEGDGSIDSDGNYRDLDLLPYYTASREIEVSSEKKNVGFKP